MTRLQMKIFSMILLAFVILVAAHGNAVTSRLPEVTADSSPDGVAKLERIDLAEGQIVIEDRLLFIGPSTQYFTSNRRVASPTDFEEGALVEYLLDGQHVLAMWQATVTDFDTKESVIEGAAEPSNEIPAVSEDDGFRNEPSLDGGIRLEGGVWTN